MTGPPRTNQELLEENSALKQKIKELEHSATELKRVEEALRKSEENYRRLFDNSPSAIYQIDFRTRKLLKGNDIMCEFLGCSQEDISSISAFKVDLVLLDMIMDRGMDGLDTYRSILEILPKQKAIIVSGFSDTQRVHAAQSLGVGAYVRKPYVMEKLGMAVRQELN